MDYHLPPLEAVQEYVCEKFPTEVKVLEACKYMMTMQIVYEPRILKFVRQCYEREGKIRVRVCGLVRSNPECACSWRTCDISMCWQGDLKIALRGEGGGGKGGGRGIWRNGLLCRAFTEWYGKCAAKRPARKIVKKIFTP